MIFGTRTLWPCLVLGALAAVPASAQEFPSKPIRIISPGPSGVPTDIMLRFIADKLNQRLGWSAVVEPKPGGNFVPSVLATTQAPADGHVVLNAVGSLAIVPYTVKDVPFDLRKDLAPLVRFATTPSVLAVNPSIPARNLAELVAYSKANPGKLNYANLGLGTSTHLQGEVLRMQAGLDMTPVPYKDSNAIGPDLVTGRIEAGIQGLGTFVSLFRDGKLRPIVMIGAARSALLPDVPSAAEATGQDFDIVSWSGFMLRSGTPRAVAERMERELAAIVVLPETREVMLKGGIEPLPEIDRSEAFGRKVEADLRRWERVVREIRFKPI